MDDLTPPHWDNLPHEPETITMTEMDDDRLEFVVRKDGYFYRPKAQGYTTNIDEAGLFTELDAWRHSHPNGKDGPRDGMSYHHKSEFPSALATARAEAEALRALAIEALELAEGLHESHDYLGTGSNSRLADKEWAEDAAKIKRLRAALSKGPTQ